MVRFYDPASREDQERVEAILQSAGIEYFLAEEPAAELGPSQIKVAEEDIPYAEKALQEARAGNQSS